MKMLLTNLVYSCLSMSILCYCCLGFGNVLKFCFDRLVAKNYFFDICSDGVKNSCAVVLIGLLKKVGYMMHPVTYNRQCALVSSLKKFYTINQKKTKEHVVLRVMTGWIDMGSTCADDDFCVIFCLLQFYLVVSQRWAKRFPHCVKQFT